METPLEECMKCNSKPNKDCYSKTFFGRCLKDPNNLELIIPESLIEIQYSEHDEKEKVRCVRKPAYFIVLFRDLAEEYRKDHAELPFIQIAESMTVSGSSYSYLKNMKEIPVKNIHYVKNPQRGLIYAK